MRYLCFLSLILTIALSYNRTNHPTECDEAFRPHSTMTLSTREPLDSTIRTR